MAEAEEEEEEDEEEDDECFLRLLFLQPRSDSLRVTGIICYRQSIKPTSSSSSSCVSFE